MSSALLIACFSPTGTSTRLISCGCSRRILADNSGIEVALNGSSPSSNSYKITASDQMSVLASTSLVDRICSGDIYRGEPIIEEVRVSEGSVPSATAKVFFEIPKSSTLILLEPSG